LNPNSGAEVLLLQIGAEWCKVRCADGELGYIKTAYLHFDPDVETGQPVKGDIVMETVDNTNLLFGNPYRDNVQDQPYLILVKR